jgi:hypothetical protein
MRKLGEGSTPLRPAVPNPLQEESRMEDTIADPPDVRRPAVYELKLDARRGRVREGCAVGDTR